MRSATHARAPARNAVRAAASAVQAQAAQFPKAPTPVRQVVESPGQPLEAGVRELMEPRLGHDFSRVRVHADGEAADSARGVGALAYTVGQHVVFGAGQYSPTSSSGKRLIAHELTHVVQQAGRAQPVLQRACGPREIGEVAGCTESTAEPPGDRVLFNVNCDTLRPRQLDRIVDVALRVSNGDTVVIHGFASEEGSADFNRHLSCQRARIAQAMLAYALSLRHVQAQYRLFQHGATTGARPEHRSVVISIERAPIPEQRPPPVRPEPPPVRQEPEPRRDMDASVPSMDAGRLPSIPDAGDYGRSGVPPVPSIDAGLPPLPPARTPQDITVLDWGQNWNAYNLVGGVLTIGEIDVTSVRNMVSQIRDHVPAETSCIHELTIIGHGAPGQIAVGAGTGYVPGSIIDGGSIDPTSPYYRPDERAALARLAPLFCSYGSVTLRGCNVGDGPRGAAFVQQLANLWHVPVRAHIGTARGGGYWVTGQWRRASPTP